MGKGIKDLYRQALAKGASNIAVPKGKKGIHTLKFHKTVTSIAKSGSAANPYAVAMSKLGRDKAIKKKYRKVARPER